MFLCTESEREGNTKKELSLKKCGKSVAESVAATKVWHTKCGRVAGWQVLSPSSWPSSSA